MTKFDQKRQFLSLTASSCQFGLLTGLNQKEMSDWLRMSVSVVIPCLNEEESIEECVRHVKEAFASEPELEVLVVDNGSTDASKELASKAGARVVEEKRRGYGSAILTGFREARGEYLVMGDADNTYDFRDAVDLVNDLKEGADFAIGNRLAKPEKGAMPWAHQHIGTPVLTFVLNWFYGTEVKDVNCGLRAIRKESFPKLRLRSPGMEFASEMVIHARKAGLKLSERPIHYYVRRGGEAKLRTIRDGWRHLRFILLFAPFHVFVLPALAGMLASTYFYASDRFGYQVLGSLLNLASVQVLIFGILAKAFLWTHDSFVVDQKVGRMLGLFRLEYGILVSFLFLGMGGYFFAQIDLSSLIRGSMFVVLATQIFFSSFLWAAILFKSDTYSPD